MKDINIEILMGLPGSGKTHYAKTYDNHRAGVYAVILDELSDIRCYGRKHTMEELIHLGVCDVYRNAKKIILDGPFFTNEHVRIALHVIAQEYGKVDVVIHHWEENRDYCLKNDGGRREVKSSYTIENADYESPNVAWLNEQLAENDVHITKIVEHDVELKPEWIRYWRPIQYHDDGKLYSQSWCTGGCWNDCWGGRHPASAEEPPAFVELEELLEKVAPHLTFLQYKRIERECVSTHSYHESDYYGGGVGRCQWVCDLEKLYEILHDYGHADV